LLLVDATFWQVAQTLNNPKLGSEYFHLMRCQST